MKNPPSIFDLFEERPLLIMLAGPNGAGKSTFFQANLSGARLPFLNADNIARELGIDSYEAAKIASVTRRQFLTQRRSFIFETVFSDPAGDKLGFLIDAAESGYTVILVFIGIDGSETSQERVGMRVLYGGHDVPIDKLHDRFPRTMSNLAAALKIVQNVFVYDNNDLALPYQQIAVWQNGSLLWQRDKLPRWFAPLVTS